jgi:glycosyltransferase involved in cell wall biosynthesis
MRGAKKVAIVRGKYLNRFEMQNYAPLKDRFELTAFASLTPIHEDVGFPVKKLLSPMDFPNFPYKLPLLNRLMVDAMYLAGLEKALTGYDLVCARETYFHFTQQALKAKRQGRVKKVLVTCSETILHNHEGIRGRKQFKQRVIHEADHFHCLTEKAKRCLVEEGADPEKIDVIGYGIDLNKFKKQEVRSKNQDKIQLLFVGRIEEQKGIGESVEAYTQLKKDFPQVELTVVGKGPLQAVVEQAGAKVMTLPYSQMPKAYREADIFVLPSKPTQHWEEYYGMALLEAMASGLPVVTSDCGAIPEVVGKAAIVVPHSQAKPLYQALERFVESKNLRQSYGQKAHKHAQTHFDCLKQGKQLGRLFQELLG